MPSDRPGPRIGFIVAWVIFALTILQLAVATFVPDIPQFEGKAFGSRLIAYPLLMLAVPVVWILLARRDERIVPVDWTAMAFIWAPFLVDVSGNSADLYDTVVWWDDANHYFNWLLLCTGVGLILRYARDLRALGARRDGLGHRRDPRDPLGAGGVVRVHPARNRTRHGVRRHARRSGARHPRWNRSRQE